MTEQQTLQERREWFEENFESITAYLLKRYGWPLRSINVTPYETVDQVMNEYYTSRCEGYFPEPFVTHVYEEWQLFGVTAFSGGDNNMGQWIDFVLQPDVKITDLDQPEIR